MYAINLDDVIDRMKFSMSTPEDPDSFDTFTDVFVDDAAPVAAAGSVRERNSSGTRGLRGAHVCFTRGRLPHTSGQ